MSQDHEPRIALLPLDEAKKAAAEVEVPEAMADLSVFRVLLRQPRVAKQINDLLITLLFRGQLDGRLRELVIMRIGWATGSSYEWTQHWRVAQEQFSVTADDLLGLRDWRNHAAFGPPERAVLAATDEFASNRRQMDGSAMEAFGRRIGHVVARHLEGGLGDGESRASDL